MSVKTAAVILAAGLGKRMKSDLPKVLHTVNGRALVSYLLETLAKLSLDKIVVVIGHKGEMVKKELQNFPVEFVWQNEQRGTGDAVKCALPALKDFSGCVIVANGDVPFLAQRTLESMITAHHESGASATCMTVVLEDPKNYGRILREGNSDRLEAIVEKKDATPEILKIREINSGVFCFNAAELFWALDFLDDNNAQKEYYITDTIKILKNAGKLCQVFRIDDPFEVEGVNSPEELQALEAAFNSRMS